MQIEAARALYSGTVQEFLGGTEENNSKPESEEPRIKPVTSRYPLHRHAAM
jgi:hypothetical protein